MADWKNKLYFGDNLDILREHVADASVDLIYLDPPFNSNATYNVLFRETSGEGSVAQIEAFDDTWHWSTTESGLCLPRCSDERAEKAGRPAAGDALVPRPERHEWPT